MRQHELPVTSGPRPNGLVLGISIVHWEKQPSLVGCSILSLLHLHLAQLTEQNITQSSCFFRTMTQFHVLFLFHGGCKYTSLSSVFVRLAAQSKIAPDLWRKRQGLVCSPGGLVGEGRRHLEVVFNEFTHLKFNSSPLKSYRPNEKVVFQPSFFSVYVKLRGCKCVLLQSFSLIPFITVIDLYIPDGTWVHQQQEYDCGIWEKTRFLSSLSKFYKIYWTYYLYWRHR